MHRERTVRLQRMLLLLRPKTLHVSSLKDEASRMECHEEDSGGLENQSSKSLQAFWRTLCPSLAWTQYPQNSWRLKGEASPQSPTCGCRVRVVSSNLSRDHHDVKASSYNNASYSFMQGPEGKQTLKRGCGSKSIRSSWLPTF